MGMKPISYWSWGLMTRCPKSYHEMVIKRAESDRTITHPRTVLGSIVHGAMEHGFKKNRKDGTPSEIYLNWPLATIRAVGAIAEQTDPRMLATVAKKSKPHVDWIVDQLKTLFNGPNEFHPEITLSAPHPESGEILKGRIDLVVVGGGVARIYDYKGVARAESLTREQVWFYKRLVEYNFKVPVVECAYIWFTERAIVPRDPSKIDEQMNASIIKMKQDVTDGKFPAVINRLCDYCAVRANCAEYQKAIGGTVADAPTDPGRTNPAGA